MTNNLNAYHNAYYAKTRDDLKYKKDRCINGNFEIYFSYAKTRDDLKYKKDRCINGNFEIYFSYADDDVIVARSYWTDIANIDNKNKRAIITWERYSHTTGKQIDELLRAMPSDYRYAFVDSSEIMGDHATQKAICDKMFAAGCESLDWVNGHEYKIKDRADWLKHLQNVRACYPTDIYTDAREKMDSYERVVW